MKKYIGAILGLIFIFASGHTISAQKSNQSESVSTKNELKQMNEFIKKTFSETYKYKGFWKYLNSDSKKEVQTTMTYKGRLASFEGCNISFFSVMKVASQKSDSSENVSFSLKDIDLNKTYFSTKSFFSDDKDTVTIHFKAKAKLIKSRGQFLSTFSGPNTGDYSETIRKTEQYVVTLKPSATIDEIETTLRNAVKICQEK